MSLADDFARLLRPVHSLAAPVLEQVAVELHDAQVDVLDCADELKAGGSPDALLDRLGSSLSHRAARIAAAQAIDAVYGSAVTRFSGRRSDGDVLRALELSPKRGRDSPPTFNGNVELGLVLPMPAHDGHSLSGIDREAVPPALADFFGNLLYVPPVVAASHPDHGGRASELVPLRWVSPTRRKSVPHVPGEALRVGYAPVAETSGDVAIHVRADPTRHWYSARPEKLGSRTVEVIRRLAGAGANIVALPETVLQEEELGTVAAALRGICRDPGCPLRMVLVGVAAPPACPGGHSANAVVVFDSRGRPVARQEKLSRWNWTREQRSRFGVDVAGAGVRAIGDGDLLYEDIRTGPEVVVVELDGVGRFVIHVCADLQAHEPGNWLRRNLPLDWSMTPLLDGHITLKPTKWSFAKALEAARDGRTRTLVTTSFALAHRQNDLNAADPAKARYVDPNCGVMLLLDGRYGDVRGLFAEHPLAPDPAGPLARAIDVDPDSWPKVARCGSAGHGRLQFRGSNLGTVIRATMVRMAGNAPLMLDCRIIGGPDPDMLDLDFDAASVGDPSGWDIHLVGKTVQPETTGTVHAVLVSRIPETAL